MPNKQINISFSEGDLQELQEGGNFDWTYKGVDVHIFLAVGTCARCSEDIETDGEEDLCPDCEEKESKKAK